MVKLYVLGGVLREWLVSKKGLFIYGFLTTFWGSITGFYSFLRGELGGVEWLFLTWGEFTSNFLGAE